MDEQLKSIVDKLDQDSSIGLPRHEIERIVQETVRQLEEKDAEEMEKMVAATD